MKYRFLTLISSLLLLTACSDSFLERAPEGNYVDVTFYTSDKAGRKHGVLCNQRRFRLIHTLI